MRNQSQATATTQRRYERQAALFDLSELAVELLAFRALRRRLWARVAGGPILDVGAGTGKNIPHYPQDSRVVALDLSPRMLNRAVGRARRLGREVDFVLADAQHLPFRDGAFAAAVATFVFCSVPDPIAGLEETRRVVRDNGRLQFLEHVRAANAVIGWLMDRLNPIAVRLTGAHINRDTVANVEEAGIALASVESRGLGILKLVEGTPEPTLSTSQSDAASGGPRHSTRRELPLGAGGSKA